jgi:ubiquinone biosynthesis protein UbiJ
VLSRSIAALNFKRARALFAPSIVNIEALILPVLNHLVQQESWAIDRLRPFSGSQFRVVANSVNLDICISHMGLFEPAPNANLSDVVLTLPSDTFFKLLTNRNALFSSVKLAGSADLAECLAFVFRNLRFDFEADLASVLGDIPARRIALMAENLSNQSQNGIKRFSQNVFEYVTEDSNLLTPTRDIQTFSLAVNTLRDDLARLEKRINLL